VIVFNFIQQPIPDVVQVSKNLRVCGDCRKLLHFCIGFCEHLLYFSLTVSAIKLIAKIRRRQIILRDANRLHHFDIYGQCSCQDHF
jgi:hypothetical protein